MFDFFIFYNVFGELNTLNTCEDNSGFCTCLLTVAHICADFSLCEIFAKVSLQFNIRRVLEPPPLITNLRVDLSDPYNIIR